MADSNQKRLMRKKLHINGMVRILFDPPRRRARRFYSVGNRPKILCFNWLPEGFNQTAFSSGLDSVLRGINWVCVRKISWYGISEFDSSLRSFEMKEKPQRRCSDLSFRMVGEEIVILDRANGLIHQLNSTASYIWKHCDGSSMPQRIIEQLAHAFEIDLASAERDVIGVLGEMKKLILLECSNH